MDNVCTYTALDQAMSDSPAKARQDMGLAIRAIRAQLWALSPHLDDNDKATRSLQGRAVERMVSRVRILHPTKPVNLKSIEKVSVGIKVHVVADGALIVGRWDDTCEYYEFSLMDENGEMI